MLAFKLDETHHDGQADLDLKRFFIGPCFFGTPVNSDKIKLFRDILSAARERAVFDWWYGLTRAGIVPDKSDLRIQDMAPYISAIALVESGDFERPRIRLAGEIVENLIGRGLTGCPVDVLVKSSDELQAQFRAIDQENLRPRYSVRDLRQVGKEYRVIGVLELPVRETSSGKLLILMYFEVLGHKRVANMPGAIL